MSDDGSQLVDVFRGGAKAGWWATASAPFASMRVAEEFVQFDCAFFYREILRRGEGRVCGSKGWFRTKLCFDYSDGRRATIRFWPSDVPGATQALLRHGWIVDWHD